MKTVPMALLALLASSLSYAQPPGDVKPDSIPPLNRAELRIHAVAVLVPTAGHTARGTITFEPQGSGVHVVAHLMGLAPGDHGMHIHEWGDCSAPDGSSAGDHFAMPNQLHGAPLDKLRHVGDLGNITAAADSTATLEVTDPMLSLSGVNSIIGRAVVVHANPDDFKTQPAGAAGARIACGVVGLASGK